MVNIIKCNSAYSSGGPAQAISMLNTNLDLDIEYYVSVDFAALTKTVDLLGGIDIDVDDAEIEHLNNYIVETSKVTGIQTQPLTSTGLQTLDGVQATSYCRIRYTAGDDFKRTGASARSDHAACKQGEEDGYQQS